MSKVLNFDFLKNEKSVWSEKKTFSLVSQMLSFRLKKQSSKNVVDTAFKVACMVDIKLLFYRLILLIILINYFDNTN